MSFLNLCGTRVIRTKVAILGSGMAGMAAARTLSENGISDFLIIEAQSTLGGRMKEIKFGGYTIELGPSWIQGIRNNETGEENPIWTLANKHKLMNIYTDYDDLFSNIF
ncbi:unnamed protein product [Rotaria sp. Silwood2]|nr:unnamed protein product [Rotaria sp. Silwood2]